jgi:uncharacterized protein
LGAWSEVIVERYPDHRPRCGDLVYSSFVRVLSQENLQRPISVAFVATVCIVVASAVLRPFVAGALDSGAVQTWTTIFVSMCLQATPFLVLGVLVSGAITAFVRADQIAALLPRNPAATVPVACLAGVFLPGCECGAVPISGRLMNAGVPRPAALAFLLAAPAANPVVLVSTAVAFPGQPALVWARLLAALATAMVVGWISLALGLHDRIRLPRVRAEGLSRFEAFRHAMVQEFVHAGGFLVVGAAVAASLQVLVPRTIIDRVASMPVVDVLLLAVLAFLLAVCSEADGFVAASLWQFSSTAKLTFMVVGPVIDIKLLAMQQGVFGRWFAVRFASISFLVAIVTSVSFGWWLL